MPDNVTLASGDIIATKDVGGSEKQVVMLADLLGNIIDSVLLQNGRGLLVVNLGDSACKGVALRGQPVSTQPVTIGGRATTSLISQVTPITEGNVVDASVTGDGRQLIHPWCSPEDQLSTIPVVLTTTGDVQLYASLGTGLKIALIGMIVSNTGVDTDVIVKDGTTVVGRIPAAVAARGNALHQFPLPIRGTAATAMNVALSGASTSVIVTPFAYRTRI